MEGVELQPPLILDVTGWGKDAWHHLAVTWRSGRDVEVFFDGKSAGTATWIPGLTRDVPSSARLALGVPDNYYGPNHLAVDEFRISSVARRPEELGFHRVPLLPDPCTLLLENFENVSTAGTARVTSAAVLADAQAPRQASLVGGRLGPGKSGTAWFLGD